MSVSQQDKVSDSVFSVAVVTLFPEMFSAFTDYGISGRAVEKGLMRVGLFNPRDYTHDKHRTVDDRPYGGGPGMVMMAEPLASAIEAAKDWANSQTKPCKVVYLSPQGQIATQKRICDSLNHNLVFIAGRYEGIDERVIANMVDEEWSIGDYVLSGGELPAMVLMDAMVRWLPGALGDAQSAEQDSFVNGWLDCPHYTRPETYDGEQVPAVLLSGNHKEISRWRLKQSLGRTAARRPELVCEQQLTAEQYELLQEYKRELATKKANDQGQK